MLDNTEKLKKDAIKFSSGVNHKFSSLVLEPKETLRGALAKIARNKPGQSHLPAGIVLIVDKEQKLLGIATDGDIRRALSGGMKLDAPISGAMNKKPFLVEGPKSNMEILSLVVEKIKKENWHKDRLDKIIVVDKNRKVLDLLSFYDLWQQSDVRFKHVGVVGLGFVGLTLGLTLSDFGFTVRGTDKNKSVTGLIRSGKAPFFELGLPALLKDHLGKKFMVVDNFNRENNCEVYFIAVGTPLDKNNKPDLKYLGDASRNLGKLLKRGDSVILRSTVPVGTTRNFVAPLLEEHSGLKAGEDFFIAFAPERTVEGKALLELRQLPQIIGGINHQSADHAASIFGFMTKSTVLVDTLEEAEMVKLINNTYRDVTFGFANEVSLIAGKWGIDAKRVIEAANYGYERSSVPLPSPGVGGYCLEKDPYIFMESARAKGYEPQLIKHARRVSDMMVEHVADSVSSFLKSSTSKKNPKILALGVAFKGKPVTSDVRGSTAIKIIKKLQQENYNNIFGFDPAVSKENVLAHNMRYVKDLKAGFAKADVVFVGTNHPDFEALNIRQLLSLSERPVLLFDSWGLFNKEEVSKIKGVQYRRL